MSSYAVLWRDDESRATAGRLELDSHGLWLHGGGRGAEVCLEVPYGDIESVEHDVRVRIGSCRGLRLVTRHAGTLVIATVAGTGMLGEIRDRLGEVLGLV